MGGDIFRQIQVNHFIPHATCVISSSYIISINSTDFVSFCAANRCFVFGCTSSPLSKNKH